LQILVWILDFFSKKLVEISGEKNSFWFILDSSKGSQIPTSNKSFTAPSKKESRKTISASSGTGSMRAISMWIYANPDPKHRKIHTGTGSVGFQKT